MNFKTTLALAITILGLASCTTTGSTDSNSSADTPPPRGYNAPVSPYAAPSGS